MLNCPKLSMEMFRSFKVPDLQRIPSPTSSYLTDDDSADELEELSSSLCGSPSRSSPRESLQTFDASPVETKQISDGSRASSGVASEYFTAPMNVENPVDTSPSEKLFQSQKSSRSSLELPQNTDEIGIEEVLQVLRIDPVTADETSIRRAVASENIQLIEADEAILSGLQDVPIQQVAVPPVNNVIAQTKNVNEWPSLDVDSQLLNQQPSGQSANINEPVALPDTDVWPFEEILKNIPDENVAAMFPQAVIPAPVTEQPQKCNIPSLKERRLIKKSQKPVTEASSAHPPKKAGRKRKKTKHTKKMRKLKLMKNRLSAGRNEEFSLWNQSDSLESQLILKFTESPVVNVIPKPRFLFKKPSAVPQEQHLFVPAQNLRNEPEIVEIIPQEISVSQQTVPNSISDHASSGKPSQSNTQPGAIQSSDQSEKRLPRTFTLSEDVKKWVETKKPFTPGELFKLMRAFSKT